MYFIDIILKCYLQLQNYIKIIAENRKINQYNVCLKIYLYFYNLFNK